MELKKKGMFFSSDALIAIVLLLIGISLIIPFMDYTENEKKVSSDLVKILSNLKIGEINNSYAKQLINEGKIENINNSILEQVGEFYLTNQTLAKELLKSIMDNINFEIDSGVWYEDDLIYSVNETPIENAKNIQVERQIITGLRKGESVTGFSSRAFLQNNLRTNHFYFGGYVGDGNISVLINSTGNAQEIIMEITANEDFNVYINDEFSGHYQNSSSDFSPAIYDLSAYTGNFNNGENILKFVGDNETLHIAGGYLKVIYSNSSVDFTHLKKYNFPGIEGLINIYDGFYIPSTLNEMNIFLHYNSQPRIFLNIGNTTIYNGSSEGETTVTITNSELSSYLNYNQIINKTIPLRLGIENASYVSQIQKYVDIFSVTDLSGSMNDCGTYTPPYMCNYNCILGGAKRCEVSNPSLCKENVCGGTCWVAYNHNLDCSETLIDLAKDANKEFINVVLEHEGNKVGLVGYSTTVLSAAFHNLSDNQTSLENKIDSWTTSGGTCICCGIEDAMERLSTINNDSRIRVIVVMSDGEANYNCEGGSSNAKQSAIDKACEAYEDYNIIVHSVGFGSNADEETLESIANCGNGSYYFGNVSELAEIYKQIAQDIIEASYSEQTIETTANISTILYPDSYIEFNYTNLNVPYGLLLSLQENFLNETHAVFAIPENSSLVDVNVISYSGPRWTSKVKINNEDIYNIVEYQTPFIDLGDPYKINIPVYKINQPENNSIEIYTSTNPYNDTNGSINNKLFYTILKEFSSYSLISSTSEGCVWTIEFEDESNKTINVPSNYSGTNQCKYTQSEINYDLNDAIQISVYELLKKMDFNLNGKIDLKFSEEDLVISSSEVFGIPYGWATEVQVRTWY